MPSHYISMLKNLGPLFWHCVLQVSVGEQKGIKNRKIVWIGMIEADKDEVIVTAIAGLIILGPRSHFCQSQL